MEKNEELKRLKALRDGGFKLSEEEMEKLKASEERTSETPAEPVTPTTSEPAEEETLIPLNLESFDRGGNQFWPPPEPKVYPAVCDGIMTPDFKEDQCWFIFKNAEDAPSFRGMLITANLRGKTESSGAWKVKDVLDALDVEYRREPGQGVYVKDPKGISCQVNWQWVNLPRGWAMRIQDVYSAEKNIEQL